jgi:H+/Cl- antiporter ClcA
MIGFDPLLFVGLGALLGLIVNGTRLRPLGRFLPPLALGMVVAGMFGFDTLPAPLMYALVGAGAVVSVIRLFGGK